MRPYLVIVENKAERSRDRPERTEGTCGVSYSTEQLGRGRRGRLAARFVLIRGGARFEGFVGTNNVLSVIRNDGGVYIVGRNGQRGRPKRACSRTVELPTV